MAGSQSKFGQLIEELVRPVVILGFTFATIYAFLISKLINSDAFLPIAMLAIGYLFGRQDQKKEAETPNGSIPTIPFTSTTEEKKND